MFYIYVYEMNFKCDDNLMTLCSYLEECYFRLCTSYKCH